MEVDGLAELAHDLGAQRIDADEQALEQGAVRQRVTRCVPLDAVVAANDHERRLLRRARLGIPGDAERRLPRPRVAARLDRGDAHC
jgi:hypothetical protein